MPYEMIEQRLIVSKEATLYYVEDDIPLKKKSPPITSIKYFQETPIVEYPYYFAAEINKHAEEFKILAEEWWAIHNEICERPFTKKFKVVKLN
jgi:hypothetical protein